jgi:hypothetical protein
MYYGRDEPQGKPPSNRTPPATADETRQDGNEPGQDNPPG